MSDSSDQAHSQRGGYSLSGSSPAEPLPAGWSRSGRSISASEVGSGRGSEFSNRIGRIGAWGEGGSSSSPSPSAGRFATLRDITGSSGPSTGTGLGGPGSFGIGGTGGDDDDYDAQDVDENDAGESWYAGGERSGISIENPDRRSGNNVVRDILRKAAEAGAPLPPAAPSGPFSGPAYTLGSDDIDSSYVPDPNAHQSDLDDDQEVATRHITFWRDGFSVEDGPLMRYDEPANSQLLEEINTGHAPPQILNVRIGQPVELRVTRRLNDDYVPPPKRPMRAFEGQGHRLGMAMPVSITSNTDERRSIQRQFEVDQTLPTTSVQVRLADGTRLVARMNLHHTVGDIRNFINASQPGSSGTRYTIQTTFPNRILEDTTQTIEQAELKNSVVVQKLV